MTAPRDPDRLIEAFLGTGPTELPDRAYDAVRDHIEHTRQRVVIGPWREPTMSNLARVAIAAAVILAVGFGASRLLPGTPGVVGGPSAMPSPSASTAPSLAAASPTAVTPFTLTIDAPFAARLDFQATSDFKLWGDIGESGKGWYKHSADPPNGVGVTVWKVDNARVGTCGYSDMDPPLGPSVDDLADALIRQPHTVLHEDSPVTLDGYSGRYLDYTADLSNCTKLNRWTVLNGLREALDGEHDRVWILDVDGARVVIDAFDFEGSSERRPCGDTHDRGVGADQPELTLRKHHGRVGLRDPADPPVVDTGHRQVPPDLVHAVGRDRREQAARRLRVVGEGHELRGHSVADGQERLDEAAVVGGAAGLDAIAREVERPVERRERRPRRIRTACRMPAPSPGHDRAGRSR